MTTRETGLKYDPELEMLTLDTKPYTIHDLALETEKGSPVSEVIGRLTKTQLRSLQKSMNDLGQFKTKQSNYFTARFLTKFLKLLIKEGTEREAMSKLDTEELFQYKKNKYRKSVHLMTILTDLNDPAFNNLVKLKDIDKTTPVHRACKLYERERVRLKSIDSLCKTLSKVIPNGSVSPTDITVLLETTLVPFDYLVNTVKDHYKSMTTHRKYALARIIYKRSDNPYSKTELAQMFELDRRKI